MLDWAAVSATGDNEETLLERATHDLLNPVASILGIADTIRSRGSTLDDATLRRFGESITRQAARFEAAVGDLVRATRLLQRDPVMSVQNVSLVSITDVLGPDRVRVEVLRDATVAADPVLLADVLQRLVANSLEHSTSDVVISGGAGWLEVADRGVGFTDEGLERAFEPLSAGANARGERGSGLGLGLYIARRLVEAMGGTLSAKSAPGEGSTFRIELPG